MKRIASILAATVLLGCVAGCGGSSGGGQNATGQFVGETDDGTASVALVRIGGKVVGYVCNDDDVGEWFEVVDSPALDTLTSAGGATITLRSPGRFARGAFITTDGGEHAFRLRSAKGSEGLYLLFGDDVVDLSARPLADVTVEEIINNALVELIALHRGVSDRASFRAGWIIGPGGRIVGNITLPRSGLAPVGNLLPLNQTVLTGTTLSVRRLEGALTVDTPLERPAKTSAGNVPQSASACGDGFDLSQAGCCDAIRFNQLLVVVGNGLADAGLESETIDSLMNECAETIVDFCGSVNGNSCVS